MLFTTLGLCWVLMARGGNFGDALCATISVNFCSCDFFCGNGGGKDSLLLWDCKENTESELWTDFCDSILACDTFES
jgi:hypothetical protein